MRKESEKMSDNTMSQVRDQSSTPNADLKPLAKLIGTWKVSGGVQGTIRYEWAEGGFFLMQHVDLDHDGRKIKGIEMIGHLQPLGEVPGKDIATRFYSFTDGLTLDYVYEMDANTLTIWGGYKGSPACFKGTLSADGNHFAGAWVYPGGGYEAIGERVR